MPKWEMQEGARPPLVAPFYILFIVYIYNMNLIRINYYKDNYVVAGYGNAVLDYVGKKKISK